jgi:ADP-ribose pyrophosphatase
MSWKLEIIRRDPVFQGFLQLARYWLRIASPEDKDEITVYRECVEGLRSAVVLPYDPTTGRIVLVEQFRIGALASVGGGWLHEPPGGLIEDGQTPEEAARREAMEEAGCRIGALIPIGLCRTSPGFSDECVALFCGETDASGLPLYGGRREEGECTRVVGWELDRALCELGQEPLTAATVIIAVQWLALNLDRLGDLWGRTTTMQPGADPDGGGAG